MLARAAEFPWITHAVFQAVCMLYQGMLGKATETMAAVLKAQVRAGIGHVPALARARKDGPARSALLHPGSAPVPTGASLGPHGTNRNLHPVRRHAGRAGRWRARLVLLLLCFWFWGGRCPSSSPSSRRETEQIAGFPERTRHPPPAPATLDATITLGWWGGMPRSRPVGSLTHACSCRYHTRAPVFAAPGTTSVERRSRFTRSLCSPSARCTSCSPTPPTRRKRRSCPR